MYRVARTIVKQNKHPELHRYLVENGVLATSLYNASLFRIRQNFTMHGKDVLHPLEQEVREEIQRTIAEKHLGAPKRCMSYLFLEKLMRTTGNPDYFSKLPAHVAQHVLKQACADFKNWRKACRSYKKDPSRPVQNKNRPTNQCRPEWCCEYSKKTLSRCFFGGKERIIPG